MAPRPKSLKTETMPEQSYSLAFASIYRYPVKGLTPEPMQRRHAEARPDPAGRPAYAIENGPIGLRPGSAAIFSRRPAS